MARYAILKGVGTRIRPVLGIGSQKNLPEMWRKWPHLVAQGPSGQLAILPPFSGFGSPNGVKGGAASAYIAYNDVINHVSIAWKHNSCLHWWRHGLDTAGSDISMRFHPYKWEDQFTNGDILNFDDNSNFDFYTIEDGSNHTLHMFATQSVANGSPGISHQDGIFWANPAGQQPSYEFGNWTGQLPFEVQTSPLGKFPGMRMFGNPGSFEHSHFTFPAQQAAGNLSEGIQAWMSYRDADPGTQSNVLCDMIDFEGTIYYCTQTTVMAKRIGTKGSFIYMDFWDDRQAEFGGDTTFGLGGTDIDRGTQSLYGGPVPRKFAKHHVDGEPKLFMLQGDGQVFEVDHASIKKTADLTKLRNSPFGSGILGGAMQITPLVGQGLFGAPQAFRPYMVSFNNQLNAFLNYSTDNATFQTRTGTPVGKSVDGFNAQGVCWFTSFDGVNWTDKTEFLANASTSGIITPSGNTVQRATWDAITAPYIHSSFQNVPYPSGYGGRSSIPDERNHVGEAAPIDRGDDSLSVLKPSGYRQATGEPKETSSRHEDDVASGKAHMGGDTDRLPIWTSGNLQDAPGTAFDQLQIKLDKGTISGYMFPTIVNYPSGFAFVDPADLDLTSTPTNLLPESNGGVWGPFGQGTIGWDFTGVRRRHITGYIDEADEQTNNHELRLCFSDNPPADTIVDSDQVASHFFALNKASGWRQINYAHWGGAFCGGYQAVDLHDPEVIIPSGSLDDPNPLVDPQNGRTRVKFKVLDFGFWDTVQCKFQYSIDEGLNWSDATVSGSLEVGTGTKQVDPSGIGVGRSDSEIFWLHEQDLGRGVFQMPRIRMRAEVR